MVENIKSELRGNRTLHADFYRDSLIGLTAQAADGCPIWPVKSANKLSNESSEDLERPPAEGTVALAVSTFTHAKR